MAQSHCKVIYIEASAKREFLVSPEEVKEEFDLLIKELASFGTLNYPDGKKLAGYDLYEMRVSKNGSYRCIYSYQKDNIIILCAFKKKTRKTPLREIKKALNRRKTLN